MSKPFVAHAQPAKLVQPSDGVLHHSTSLAQAETVLGSAPGNLALDAALRQRFAVRLGIVARSA